MQKCTKTSLKLDSNKSLFCAFTKQPDLQPKYPSKIIYENKEGNENVLTIFVSIQKNLNF